MFKHVLKTSTINTCNASSLTKESIKYYKILYMEEATKKIVTNADQPYAVTTSGLLVNRVKKNYPMHRNKRSTLQ